MFVFAFWENFLYTISWLNQVILMERESADEWVDSYLGMLEFYNQNIRPWYSLSMVGIIRIWFVLRYYWLLPWLSKTHRQLEELTRHNMILSTTSTSMHRSLEFSATHDYILYTSFYARVSCIFVTRVRKNCCFLLTLSFPKEQGGFLSPSVEITISAAQCRCSSDCASWPASGSQGAENIFRATMATVVGAQGGWYKRRTFFWQPRFSSSPSQVGEGWDSLCSFLGKPIPDTPWPHENRFVILD